MSDLISRSDTMKRLRDYAEQKHYNGEVELANGILKAICFIEYEENIPTAYSVEKVVAELKQQAEQYRNRGFEHEKHGYSAMADKYYAEEYSYLNAIDIVRKGGVE